MVGHLLEFTEKQSFGADGDMIRREEKHLMLPNSNLSKGSIRTITNWNRGAIVEKSFFPIGKHRQRALVQVELIDHDTLVRTTTVKEVDHGDSFVVLYQREVFERLP